MPQLLAMKSPPPAAVMTTEDCDDIFGPPRTYPTGYMPPKNRLSMISPKYRQKEERRKVLKISINKLRKIDDPEASLCRSVLINNTMKRLQKEARDEKVQKQQLNYPRCYENDNFLNLKNEFMKNDCKSNGGVSSTNTTANYNDTQDFTTNNDSLKVMDFSVVENDFDTKLAEEIETVNCLVASAAGTAVETDRFTTTRRPTYDEMDESDVQDVLSQFYMPPTPRMLTCIDDDEDVNVVDDEPLPKRIKLDPQTVSEQSKIDYRDDFSEKTNNFSVNNFMNNNIPTNNTTTTTSTTTTPDSNNSYSCGHASMFSDLQSNVYHNLIASLET